MIKSTIRIFLFALVTVIIATIVIKLDYDKALRTPNSDSQEKVIVQIDQGATVEQILTKLVDQGVIQEKWLTYVKLYLKQENLAAKLQAGTYELPKNLSIKEVIDSLQNGKNPDIWVTIPEGLRKDEIADILNQELSKADTTNFSKEEFLRLTTDKEYIQTLGLTVNISDLEGYLFPDRYAFPITTKTSDTIDKMVKNFITKVGTADTYDQIILASIVEREGFSDQDRPTIAGIFIKRLEEGWLLQACATVLYPLKDWKHEITDADKKSDSPYNTYKKPGLPPTPICNPGLESINAVRNYKKTDYYYYIHDNNAIVHYAKTLEEHNANINQYLR
ncbi:MAG TPA: endolytic transglycosylase MltG [Candidatus Dojkabacteria bacterium]|jgi:UPF0755 protein|nr:endolytic transglycosylase MltG [Candidatus Dojkabacteria bacterium]HOR05804.1 endolytic transglycosylase MltG [Candidatus Dojkabacteria bacterium]HOT60809.1 endolytic transglycosylase MltG [Candidatus Dojkabacteria bacterium]HQI92576.1 endolytic transglycosylase MltG [Candidatus Dojkabacteria bacterium]